MSSSSSQAPSSSKSARRSGPNSRESPSLDRIELAHRVREKIGNQTWSFSPAQLADMLRPDGVLPLSDKLLADIVTDVQSRVRKASERESLVGHEPHHLRVVNILNSCIAACGRVRQYRNVLLLAGLRFTATEGQAGHPSDTSSSKSTGLPSLFWTLRIDKYGKPCLRGPEQVAGGWLELVMHSGSFVLGTDQSRIFELVFAYNGANGADEFRFLIFHHGGLSACNPVTLGTQGNSVASYGDLVHVFEAIMSWKHPKHAGYPLFTYPEERLVVHLSHDLTPKSDSTPNSSKWTTDSEAGTNEESSSTTPSESAHSESDADALARFSERAVYDLIEGYFGIPCALKSMMLDEFPTNPSIFCTSLNSHPVPTRHVSVDFVKTKPLTDARTAFELLESTIHSQLGWYALYNAGWLHRNIAINTVYMLVPPYPVLTHPLDLDPRIPPSLDLYQSKDTANERIEEVKREALKCIQEDISIVESIVKEKRIDTDVRGVVVDFDTRVNRVNYWKEGKGNDDLMCSCEKRNSWPAICSLVCPTCSEKRNPWQPLPGRYL